MYIYICHTIAAPFTVLSWYHILVQLLPYTDLIPSFDGMMVRDYEDFEDKILFLIVCLVYFFFLNNSFLTYKVFYDLVMNSKISYCIINLLLLNQIGSDGKVKISTQVIVDKY